MKRNLYTTHLTKAYIESKISQESIISKYLNIPIEVVNDCITNNTLIPSVFRKDDTVGSMGIQYNKKGKLKVRDFGGFGFFEDAYGVVAYVLSHIYNRPIDTSNKQDFYFILKHIAKTFSKIIDDKEIDENIEESIQNALAKSLNTRPIIEIVPRAWTKEDKAIWNKWGVSLNYLNTHFVIPVEQYYINRTAHSDPKYYYNPKNPAYAYILGHKDGIQFIKIYFPLRNRERDTKFITNCNVLEGLPNLELNNYDYILITKSSKDRLAIGNALINSPSYGGAISNYKVGIINLPSENYRLRQVEYEWLEKKLAPDGIMVSLLDFDKTGRNGAKYLFDTYNIPYIFITRGEFGLPNYKSKDFAELCENYDKKQINRFINETLTYVRLKYQHLYDRYAGTEDLPYFA